MEIISKIEDNFKNTWLRVILSPGDFFAQMPVKGGYADPIKFAAINYLIAGIISMIIQFAFQYIMGGFIMGGFPYVVISLMSGFVSFIAILIIGFLGIFVGGGLIHLFFRALGGKDTYEGTVRLIAYASAVMVFAGIPVVNIFACLYLLYLVIIGGTKIHSIRLERSVAAVVVSAVIFAALVVVLFAAIFLWLYSTSGDSTVMSTYNYRIAVNTDTKLENLTFYLPLPIFMNESKIGDEAIIQNRGSSQQWELSKIETEHGTMLKLTANELETVLHQQFEVEPGKTGDVPTGNVFSFVRGSIDVEVSMDADHVIDTRNAANSEPVLSPKYNVTLSEYQTAAPRPSSRIPPKAWSYDSFIYADYTSSPEANVEVSVGTGGRNEWWVGGWTSNEYRDGIYTTFIGERHGWISVTGELVEGEGRYD